MSTPSLSVHEQRLVDDLLILIDYAGRVLTSADYGSHYQLDATHGLRDRADRLIKRLEQQTLDFRRSAAVKTAVAVHARNYPLGQILLDARQLGGTA